MTTLRTPVLTDEEIDDEIFKCGVPDYLEIVHFARAIEQAVLERAGADAVRDQALVRLMPEVLASLKYHGQDVSLVADIERALKGTPTAAVAALPDGLTVKQAWWAGYRAGKGVAPDTPRREALDAFVRCTKCGESADFEMSSVRVVTHWPDGTPRDERDIASDPEGVLIHDPSKPLYAAKKAQAQLSGNAGEVDVSALLALLEEIANANSAQIAPVYANLARAAIAASKGAKP